MHALSLQLSDGSFKRMDQLVIGDAVLSADAGTGALTFQPVYFFGHRLSATASQFVSLTTSSGGRLRLTPDHHIPLCTSGPCNKWQEFTPAPARAVRIGHSVLLKQGEGRVVMLPLLPTWMPTLNMILAGASQVHRLQLHIIAPDRHVMPHHRQRHRKCTGDERQAQHRGWPLQPLHLWWLHCGGWRRRLRYLVHICTSLLALPYLACLL